MKLFKVLSLVGIVATATLVTGCASVSKTSPHMGISSLEINTQLDRSDIIVLDAVEGTSSVRSILGPVLRIVDGDKIQLLGIRFFEDKSATVPGVKGLIDINLGVSAENRAYYDALASMPDADFVFVKSSSEEISGIPYLFETRRVIFRGKGVKIKADR